MSTVVVRRVGKWKKVYKFICSPKFQKYAKYIIGGAIGFAIAYLMFRGLTTGTTGGVK